MSILKLPDLGEGLQQAEIVSWHVAVGDHVVTNQPLVAVETDKAVVEVPSPLSGTVARLCAEVGESVEVGAALVEFDEGERSDSGTVVGTLAGAATGKTLATPAVRSLANELNVTLEDIEGSGPDGAILSGDIEARAAELSDKRELQPLRGVRRSMAERMARAHAEVVPATIHDEADIEHWPEGSDITLQLVQAITMACAEEPALNAWFDSGQMTRQLHKSVNMGIAVDTADGLFVPTLRDTGGRSQESLDDGIARLKADVQSRSIPPAELRGQTITLSNFGSIGGRHAELVVVPPQVAIVGAGRIASRARVHNGQLEARRTLPLSLSFDHRAVTGAEASRFLNAVIKTLEDK